jgi:alkylated DNA repair dioxygenase AlkB
MGGLFPIRVEPSDIPQITGLSYHSDYITETEELRLAAAIDRETWNCSWDRRRQTYGASYGRDKVEVQPIPAWGIALADRIRKDGLTERPFDHMLVNEYLPGQGIALHRDYEPFDRMVVSLSLFAPCLMDFRREKSSDRHSLLLEPRSLLVLSDDARYKWQHGIARRKNDRWQGIVIPRARRISLTFRSRKQGA